MAHLFGIAIGLAVVLFPKDPHIGAVRLAAYARRNVVYSQRSTIESQIAERGGIPLLIEGKRPDFELPSEFWDALYTPEYGRFSMRSSKRLPWKWNPALSGRALHDGEDDWQWLIRPADSWQRYLVEVNLATGEVRIRWVG